MKYPCNYDLLREEEMVYIAGGSALDAFNYLYAAFRYPQCNMGQYAATECTACGGHRQKDRQLGLAGTAGLWVRFLPSGADRKELSDPVK